MKRIIISFTILVSSALSIVAQEGAVERFGIFVGANDGGSERARLQWAVQDAKKIASVFSELGGIPEQNADVLAQPKISDLKKSFSKYQKLVSSTSDKQKRFELVFYYSGHSDEFGIRLGTEKLLYGDLKKLITEVHADVTVAILDSCSSGAFTRQKGGVRTQPFLVDESSDMRGYAYLTSSSEDESSQESDSLGASFFTHYLTSGLRGAADTSGEGRVTLNEAYHYAFNETLARTEHTQAGPQHASYDIKLNGTGDLVLSDITKPSATLVFDENLSGVYFVRDAKNSLIAELNKSPGKKYVLAVQAGNYTIREEKNAVVYESQVSVALKSQVNIDEKSFVSKKSQVNRIRGDEKNNVPVAPGAANDELATGTLASEILQDIGVAIVNGNEISLDLAHVESEVGTVLPSDEVTPERPIDANKKQTAPKAFGFDSFADFKYFEFSLWPTKSGELNGLGINVVGNYFNESVKGLNLSGVYGISQKEFIGADIAGIFSIHNDAFYGLSLAGIFAKSEGRFVGIEMSGALNVSDEFYGIQLAGAVNIDRDKFYGLEIAGALNYTKGRIIGAQIAPVNIADDKVVGLQLGLVNIAKSVDGLSIGLITFIKDGIHEFSVSYSSRESQLGLSWLNGTKNIYSEIGLLAGLNQSKSAKDEPFDAGGFKFGLGFRVLISDLYIDLSGGAKVLGPKTGFASSFSAFSSETAKDELLSLGYIDLKFGYNLSDVFNFWVGPGLEFSDFDRIQTYLDQFSNDTKALESADLGLFGTFSFGVNLRL